MTSNRLVFVFVFLCEMFTFFSASFILRGMRQHYTSCLSEKKGSPPPLLLLLPRQILRASGLLSRAGDGSSTRDRAQCPTAYGGLREYRVSLSLFYILWVQGSYCSRVDKLEVLATIPWRFALSRFEAAAICSLGPMGLKRFLLLGRTSSVAETLK